MLQLAVGLQVSQEAKPSGPLWLALLLARLGRLTGPVFQPERPAAGLKG